MRGRSISNSLVICSEAQNLTTELVKMIITRMGEGSRLFFDFDLCQIDNKVFSKDNGMSSMINSLQGHESFGMVTLDLVERSSLAKLASLIK
jgi:PhoH-like ATPase